MRGCLLAVEVSFLTILYLEWYLCVTEGSCVHTFSIMLSCLMLYVVHFVFVIYAMRSFTDQTRGSNEPLDRRVFTETRPEGPTSYSHERLIICVCGILGKPLSFVLTVLCDMCFRFISGSRVGTDLIVHISKRVMF